MRVLNLFLTITKNIYDDKKAQWDGTTKKQISAELHFSMNFKTHLKIPLKITILYESYHLRFPPVPLELIYFWMFLVLLWVFLFCFHLVFWWLFLVFWLVGWLVGLHPHILALCYYIFLHRLENFFVVWFVNVLNWIRNDTFGKLVKISVNSVPHGNLFLLISNLGILKINSCTKQKKSNKIDSPKYAKVFIALFFIYWQKFASDFFETEKRIMISGH